MSDSWQIQSHFCMYRGTAARLEELPDEWFEYTNAIQFVSDFYSKNCGSEENQSLGVAASDLFCGIY